MSTIILQAETVQGTVSGGVSESSGCRISRVTRGMDTYLTPNERRKVVSGMMGESAVNAIPKRPFCSFLIEKWTLSFSRKFVVWEHDSFYGVTADLKDGDAVEISLDPDTNEILDLKKV